MSFYQSIAPYYNFIFPPNPSQADLVEKEAGMLTAKRILEAGCGTGNLARMLAGKGALVEGIDLDGEMIAGARENSGDLYSLHFRQLDILKIDEVWSPDYFHGVVSFGNTLVHLPDLSSVHLFFEKARRLLIPGGRLMVQIVNYDRILDQQIEGLPTIENEHIRFERYYDLIDNGAAINFRTVLTIKKTGYTIHNEVPLLPLRQRQVLQVLKQTGYSNVRFWGNFQGDAWQENSMALIFSAEAL